MTPGRYWKSALELQIRRGQPSKQGRTAKSVKLWLQNFV
jgi:hypothetical protein